MTARRPEPVTFPHAAARRVVAAERESASAPVSGGTVTPMSDTSNDSQLETEQFGDPTLVDAPDDNAVDAPTPVEEEGPGAFYAGVDVDTGGVVEVEPPDRTMPTPLNDDGEPEEKDLDAAAAEDADATPGRNEPVEVGVIPADTGESGTVAPGPGDVLAVPAYDFAGDDVNDKAGEVIAVANQAAGEAASERQRMAEAGLSGAHVAVGGLVTNGGNPIPPVPNADDPKLTSSTTERGGNVGF